MESFQTIREMAKNRVLLFTVMIGIVCIFMGGKMASTAVLMGCMSVAAVMFLVVRLPNGLQRFLLKTKTRRLVIDILMTGIITMGFAKIATGITAAIATSVTLVLVSLSLEVHACQVIKVAEDGTIIKKRKKVLLF